MLDPGRSKSAPALVDWLEDHGGRLYLSVMTIAEIEAGILKLRRTNKVARAENLQRFISAIVADFADRVLPIDVETAFHVARLGEATHQQPIALADLIIAATAVRHGLTLLTHNMSDFRRLGIDVRDPVVELPSRD